MLVREEHAANAFFCEALLGLFTNTFFMKIPFERATFGTRMNHLHSLAYK